ncbi:MAG: B12-binding domain-containing radical SAM protein [Chloroflexi bacterium]|nr:B12-binding domain-containing radical SAM protein [Chloroflexota bacterium]
MIGEGETSWPIVVRDFQRGGKPALQPFYREAEPGTFCLGKAPLPRFDLLANAPASPLAVDPLESHEIHRLGPYNRVTIQTSRGCPWDCEFCAASRTYGPRYRTKPVERVLREVDAVRALWRRPFIEFADDNTFVRRPWAKELLRELADRHIRYFTETDVSVAEDEELLDLLYPSGCRQVLIGFESPRQSSLRGLDHLDWKARKAGGYLEAIEKIQARGVSVCGCFIVGLDTDTPAIFDELREFIQKSRLLEAQITILTPFPGTRLYSRLESEGRLLYPRAWDRCTLFDLNFRPRRMTVEQLEEGIMALWRDTWNASALAVRKQHYRRLLKHCGGASPPRSSLREPEWPTQAEEHFALPTRQH